MQILIIDDHSLFRDGVSLVLNQLNAQVNILHAADYDHAFEQLADTSVVDLVLLDLNLPGRDGFAVLDTLRRRFPLLPVVIVSASNQRKDVQRALQCGAMGYIPKESNAQVMLSALHLVLAGGIYMPPGLMHEEVTQHAIPARKTCGLTDRQYEVLLLLVEGDSNKEIARQLGLAEPTIKMHVTAILKALGASNRTQAVRKAEQLGINFH